jgi:hypothetical protein
MKFFSKGKDGGDESTVTGYWLIEIKNLFSIVLLKFEGDSRDAFHEHAFNSISWLLKGRLQEEFQDKTYKFYMPSFKPIITKKTTCHKVDSGGTSWVLSFRGPWNKTWKEYLPQGERTLTNGRIEVTLKNPVV